jgi:hypothetical protein
MLDSQHACEPGFSAKGTGAATVHSALSRRSFAQHLILSFMLTPKISSTRSRTCSSKSGEVSGRISLSPDLE